MTGTFSTILKRNLPSSLTHYIRKVRYTKAMSGNLDQYELEMPFLKKLVHEGDAVIDIGANMGWYTRILSEIVGPGGLVLSVEPIPYTYGILEYMVKTLNLANVRTLQRAVSDTDADVVMELPENADGETDYYLARIIADNDGASKAPLVRVPAITLPALFSKAGKKIAFVKVDVEGFEFRMLKPWLECIAEAAPIWLIEIWGDPAEEGGRCRKTFDLLQSIGYDAYCVFNGSLVPFHDGAVSANENYFFLTAEHARRYAAELCH
jgi:FkbM family methyltransferase